MIHQSLCHESGVVAGSVTRDVEAFEHTPPPQRDWVVILQELERTHTSRPHESAEGDVVRVVGFNSTQEPPSGNRNAQKLKTLLKRADATRAMSAGLLNRHAHSPLPAGPKIFPIL